MGEQDSLDLRDTRVGQPGSKPTLKLDPTSKQVLGREIGGYRILSELGRGGMAMVYKGHDAALDRAVAIKVLPVHLMEDPEFAQRFEREAKAAARLDHPNVVQVYSAGRTDDILFIAMKYVEGSPLSEIMHNRRLGIRESLDVVRQVALALDAAHKINIVHRDVKPSNIMVDGEGNVKVMDFGLAKAGRVGHAITEVGTYLGTPEYSSPEQCETRDVDARSDIYSLGVVLYEMLAGTLPHVAETPLSLFKKITEERPIPVGELNRAVPKSVRALLERMLEKDKTDRVQTAAEVVASVDRILRTEKLPETPREGVAARQLPVVSGRIPVGRQRQSRRVSAVAGGLLATAGVLLTGLFLFHDRFGGGDEPVVVANSNGDATRPLPVHVVPVPGRQTLVVFDFKNLVTRDTENEWLEVGITEMLIANLSQHANLEVLLRDDLVHQMNEVAHRKVSLSGDGPATGAGEGPRVNLTEETRRLVTLLRAKLLISGVFSVQDGKLRIVAHLHRVESGGRLTALASVREDGDPSGAFELVDRLSASILARLFPTETAAAPGRAGAPASPMPAPGAPAEVVPGELHKVADAMQNAGGAAGVQCESVLMKKFARNDRKQKAQDRADDAIAYGSENARTPDAADGDSGKSTGGVYESKDAGAKDASTEKHETENGQESGNAGGTWADELARRRAERKGGAAGAAGGGDGSGYVAGSETGAPVQTTSDNVEIVITHGQEEAEYSEVEANTEELEELRKLTLGLLAEQQKKLEQERLRGGFQGDPQGGRSRDAELEQRQAIARELFQKLKESFGKSLDKALTEREPKPDAAVEPAELRKQRFKIFCVVQKQLEELTPGNCQALQENAARLREVVFDESVDLQQALQEIATMIQQANAHAPSGTGPDAAAPVTQPAK